MELRSELKLEGKSGILCHREGAGRILPAGMCKQVTVSDGMELWEQLGGQYTTTRERGAVGRLK